MPIKMELFLAKNRLRLKKEVKNIMKKLLIMATLSIFIIASVGFSADQTTVKKTGHHHHHAKTTTQTVTTK